MALTMGLVLLGHAARDAVGRQQAQEQRVHCSAGCWTAAKHCQAGHSVCLEECLKGCQARAAPGSIAEHGQRSCDPGTHLSMRFVNSSAGHGSVDVSMVPIEAKTWTEEAIIDTVVVPQRSNRMDARGFDTSSFGTVQISCMHCSAGMVRP